jgi:hypothetical protein
MYAEYTPFLFILHVFLVQIGNDLFGPKKHFFPHLRNIRVRWCELGCCFDQPRTNVPRPRVPVLFLRVKDILVYVICIDNFYNFYIM